MTSNSLNRIVFIKSWAYFVVALIIGSAALLLTPTLYLILSVISGFFSLAGLVYYCLAVGRFLSGRREHGIHLAIGTGLLIAYCCVIIFGKVFGGSVPAS